MRTLAGAALMVLAIAGCGGGSSVSAPKPSAARIEKDISTVSTSCIKASFSEEGDGGLTSSKIGLAVDDLIRNFKLGPDVSLTFSGGLKAHSPRTAMEKTLSFLEAEGLSGKACDQGAAERIHEALIAG